MGKLVELIGRIIASGDGVRSGKDPDKKNPILSPKTNRIKIHNQSQSSKGNINE